jgi:hypothetical protein
MKAPNRGNCVQDNADTMLDHDLNSALCRERNSAMLHLAAQKHYKEKIASLEMQLSKEKHEKVALERRFKGTVLAQQELENTLAACQRAEWERDVAQGDIAVERLRVMEMTEKRTTEKARLISVGSSMQEIIRELEVQLVDAVNTARSAAGLSFRFGVARCRQSALRIGWLSLSRRPPCAIQTHKSQVGDAAEAGEAAAVAPSHDSKHDLQAPAREGPVAGASNIAAPGIVGNI